MLINQLAQTYARAICAIAEEKGALDRVASQLRQVEAVIRENTDLSNLLYHPRVPAQAKKETIEAVFAGELDDFVKNFLLLLIDKRRETALTAIVREYLDIANNMRNIAEAEVIVSQELSEGQKQALIDKLKKLTGKNIVLKIQLDEKILGGIIVKIGDKLIDGSVTRQLKTLKSNILSQRLSAG